MAIDNALFEMGISSINDTMEELDVEWLYDAYIPSQSFGVLIGESAVGKSTLGVDLSVAIATATPFAGYDYDERDIDRYRTLSDFPADILKPPGVLFIHGEGEASLRARFAAAYEARKLIYSRARPYAFEGRHLGDLPILLWNLICTSDGPQSLRSNVERLFEVGAYWKIKKSLGVPIRLIIVDTLMAVAGITNENDNGTMQDRINSLKRMGQLLEASVLVIAHTKKGTNEIRGASAVYNAADFVLRLGKKTSNSDILSLVQEKARHGPKQSEGCLRLSIFDDHSSVVDGNAKSLIVDWLDKPTLTQQQGMARTDFDESLDGSLTAQRARSAKVGRGEDISGFAVYMEAVQLTAMGQGVYDMYGLLCATLDAVRTEFERMYKRKAEANRKAFERAHVRAIGEGKVVVCAMADGRQLVRIAE
jgi:hypothetical protein